MGTGAVQDGLSDILQLAELLALNQPEQAVLDRHAPTLLEHVGEFTDHFYTWLETVPATAKFISHLPTYQLNRLKGHLAEHYRSMVAAQIDQDRAAALVELGQMHHRLGVSISWICGAYAAFAQKLNRTLLEIPPEDRELLRSAIYKRIHLDEGWHLAGYRRAHLSGIQLREGFYDALRITNQVLSSSTSVSTLLHAAVHTLEKRLQLPLVWVGTVDSHTHWLRIRAAAGPVAAYARKLRIYSLPTRAEGHGPGGIALATGKVVVSDWRNPDPSFSPWIARIRHFGITGSIAAPFQTNDGHRGLLSIYRTQAAPFPFGAEELLPRLAADIGAALTRIQTDRALKRLQRCQQALEKVNQMLLSAPAPEEIYKLLSEIIMQSTDAVLAYVSVIDAQHTLARIVSSGSDKSCHLPATVSIDPTKPEGWGVTGQVYRLNACVTIADARHDPHLTPWIDNVRKYRQGGFAGFPIPGLDGRPEAVLVVIARQGSFFTPDIKKLLTQLANNAGVALRSHRQRNRLEHLSIHDPLTGLPNRAYFEQTTNAALGRVDRTGNFLAIGMMDLDNFKEVNDTLGHAAGDDLLKTVAARIVATLRSGDAAARLGGDEFGLLLNLKAPDNLTEAANRLLEAVQQPIDWNGENISVAARLGFTVYPLDKADRASLLRHADAALYNAKEGPHSIEIFESALAERIENRFRIRQNFPAALAAGRIEFFLEPQADMRTGKLEGVELLARWREGDTWISPGEFISVVEGDPDLMRALDRSAISAALMLRQKFLNADMDIKLSVNVGAMHLLRPDFLEDLDTLIGDLKDRSFLRLEVTESLALRNLPLAARHLAGIKSRGMSTSLDDFGTGYTSLLYAASLPVQELKLGQEFIRGLLHDPSHLAVAISMMQFATLCQVSPIAEGVETRQELATWLRLGGQRIQGHLLGKPMPQNDFIHWASSLKLTAAIWPPVYPAEDLPLLAFQVARTQQLRLMRKNDGEDLGRWTVLPMAECLLTKWFDLRRGRYGELAEFKIAANRHQWMHQRYDHHLERVGVDDMEQWTQALTDLVGAIDRDLLKNSGSISYNNRDDA